MIFWNIKWLYAQGVENTHFWEVLKLCKAKAVCYSVIDYLSSGFNWTPHRLWNDDQVDSYILTYRFWYVHHALIDSYVILQI